jgi:hypothetical protein
MEDYMALLSNSMWDLVPQVPRANVVTGKWIFKHKLKANGSLNWYKACWVIRGFTQHPRVGYCKTFSFVVKPATIQILLTLTVSRGWSMHLHDVKNAFLRSTLNETIYCSQHASFVDPAHPQCVGSISPSTA